MSLYNSKIIFLSLFLVLLLNVSALAATFNVNSTADKVDATPGNGVCAAADGTCTLRAAIMEANASAAADTIFLPAGLFSMTIAGMAEDAAVTGDLDITNPLTIAGDTKATTILDAAGLDRMFHIHAGGSLNLSHVTIQNGSAPGEAGGAILNGGTAKLIIAEVDFITNSSVLGGAIYTIAAVDLIGVLFESNIASSAGALFAASGTSADISIIDTVFNANSASAIGAAQVTTSGNLTASNLTVSNNVASSVAGLYLQSTGSGYIHVKDSEFLSNISFAIGALALLSDTGDISVENSILNDNMASAGNGAGIYAQSNSGEMLYNQLTFSNNTAFAGSADLLASSSNGGVQVVSSNSVGAFCTSGSGCSMTVVSGAATSDAIISDVSIDEAFMFTGTGVGIYLTGFSSATVRRSFITNNILFAGSVSGGIFSSDAIILDDSVFGDNRIMNVGSAAGVYLASNMDTTIRRSSIFNNVIANAAGSAGGLLASAGGVLSIENSTIANNAVGSMGAGGGAVLSATNININNSTFSGNSAGVQGAAIFTASPTTISNTVITNSLGAANSCDTGPFTSNGNNIDDDGSCNFIAASDSTIADVKLGELGADSAAPYGMIPLAGSPLIDAGNNATCATQDQRKAARPFDGNLAGGTICDIGAIEFNDFCPLDPAKTLVGVCGCGVADTDSDSDGTLNCNDSCPFDAAKVSVGTCGCGVPDTDSNSNGVIDCLTTDEMDAFLTEIQAQVKLLKRITDKTKKKKKKAINSARKKAKQLIADMKSYSLGVSGLVLVDNSLTIEGLNNRVEKSSKKLFKLKSAKFKNNKKKMNNALKKFREALGL